MSPDEPARIDSAPASLASVMTISTIAFLLPTAMVRFALNRVLNDAARLGLLAANILGGVIYLGVTFQGITMVLDHGKLIQENRRFGRVLSRSSQLIERIIDIDLSVGNRSTETSINDWFIRIVSTEVDFVLSSPKFSFEAALRFTGELIRQAGRMESYRARFNEALDELTYSGSEPIS